MGGRRMTEDRGERVTGTPDITIHDPDDVVGGVAGDGSGERATGTPNTIYDLASVLFHALQGGASYNNYIEDAEREGDEELIEFFRRVREEDRDRAAEAQMLIAERTFTAGGQESTVELAERATAGASPVTEQTSSLPGERDIPPRRAEEAASPKPEPSSDFPGTEPIREDVAKERKGEVPPPEEIPPERAGEIPMAEEVPPPRTEEVPMAEELPTRTPPQAPLGDVQGPTSHEPLLRTEETSGEQEKEIEREREDEGLVERLTDRAGDALRDALRGEDKPRRD
jgi:hypothetical protein